VTAIIWWVIFARVARFLEEYEMNADLESILRCPPRKRWGANACDQRPSERLEVHLRHSTDVSRECIYVYSILKNQNQYEPKQRRLLYNQSSAI